MPSQYSSQLKAKAQALFRQGETGVAIARRLGLPERTVSHWCHKWREIAANEGDKEILDNEYRIALQAGALVMDALDTLAERDPEELPKHLTALNVTKGVAVDKIVRLRQLERPPDDHRQLVIVLPGMPAEPLTIDAPATQLLEQSDTED